MTHPDISRDISRETPPPVDRSLKVPHLVFGLLFLGIAGIWAVGESGALGVKDLAVLAPAVLIMAGVIGLAASLASGRNKRRTHQERYPVPFFDEHPDTQHLDHQQTDHQQTDDNSFGDTAPITEEK